MTPEALALLDPRRDLYQIRQGLADLLREGQDPLPLLHALGERDPVALGELLIGPQALKGPEAVGAALQVVDFLEPAMTAPGLYRRLVDLGGGPAALDVAARRHPSAAWLVPLSAKVEGPQAGWTHLRAAHGTPHWDATCVAYARAGAIAALIRAAEALGGPEPAMALLRAGHLDPAAEASVRALERDPSAPVVESLAAIWGPDLDPLLCRLLPHLRGRAVAELLAPYGAPYPVFGARLSVVRRALVR